MTQIVMNSSELLSIAPIDDSRVIDPFDMNTVSIEHQGDQTIYRYAQDVSAIMNQNEQERLEGRNDGAKEFRKVASVPLVTWKLWESMGITTNQKELRKALQRHREELMTTDKRLI